MNIAVTRIAEDLNIFQILVESEQPIDVAALAAKTGAAPTLLGELTLQLQLLSR